MSRLSLLCILYVVRVSDASFCATTGDKACAASQELIEEQEHREAEDVALELLQRQQVSKAKIQSNVSRKATVYWTLASEGQSCTDKCAAETATCDPDALLEIDDAQGISGIAAEAGYPCTSEVGWGYSTSPGICTNPGCCGGSCVGACSYGNNGMRSCDVAENNHYSRLCPCT